jgi:hypothetical protein
MRLTPDKSRRSRLRRAQTGIRVLRTGRVILARIASRWTRFPGKTGTPFVLACPCVYQLVLEPAF